MRQLTHNFYKCIHHRCLRRVDWLAQRDHNQPVLPWFVPKQQALHLGNIRPTSVSNYSQLHALWLGREQRKWETLDDGILIWMSENYGQTTWYWIRQFGNFCLIVPTLREILQNIIIHIMLISTSFAARLRVRSRGSEEQVEREWIKETRRILRDPPASRCDFRRKCSSHRVRFRQFRSEDGLCGRLFYRLVDLLILLTL
jgi:hypothetical protein